MEGAEAHQVENVLNCPGEIGLSNYAIPSDANLRWTYFKKLQQCPVFHLTFD